MSFHNFSTGNGHSFGGKYLEVKPNEFLKYTDKFDDPNLPGEMITSVWLQKVSAGTEMKVLQEGIPPVIPVEMCYLGWQESLEKNDWTPAVLTGAAFDKFVDDEFASLRATMVRAGMV